MAKLPRFANVYTGLLAGVVSGWMLRTLTAKPAMTKVVGSPGELPYKNPVTNKYDEGWNDGLNGQSSFDGGDRSYKSGFDAAQAYKQVQGLPLP